MERSSFEEELRNRGKLVYTNVGDSMMPLICENRDLLIIVPPSGRLKKYDIPLYTRGYGSYVLHRIIRVRKNDYVIRGDNRWNKEYGITDDNIIGVLKAIVRDGKELPVDEVKKSYLLHLPLRAFELRMKHYYKRARAIISGKLKK